MCVDCRFIGLHNHLDNSNFRLIDAINKPRDLLKTAVEQGYSGIAITDHETVSGHVEVLKLTKEMKKNGTMPEDFKLILGNEIYLIDSLEEVKDNYKSGETKFYHFLLLAKDSIGHEQLRELSSIAWSQSFFTGMMERVPTEKHVLERIVKENKGHLIASSACLGSELAIHTIKAIEARESGDKESYTYHTKRADTFIRWCIDVFGKDNFFIELQPALSREQILFNKQAIKIANYYKLRYIVTTDAHFLRPEDKLIHGAFLNSKDGEREIENFYEACFVQNFQEINERLSQCDLTQEQIIEAVNNTVLIGDMVEEYDLFHEPTIPKIEIPNFEVRHLYKQYYSQYEYISLMANSKEEQDRFLIHLIENGLESKYPTNSITSDYYFKLLYRINIELEELWKISESLKQTMSSYYITVREIINIIWDDCGGNSLVGIARGSAAGFLINYLLDITQFNPMDYDLPHWRHLHHSRPDMPDIDIDTEGSKRQTILRALKNRFGERRVLNIATFGTEGSKSAIQTACRGLGIDVDIAQHISSLIPFERGSNWTLSDCLYGNEEKQREPVREFINEIEKYPNLKEVSLKIEGIKNKRSIHAGGIYIFNEDLVKSNALMKAPSGQWITQYSMNDSEYMGNVKYDLLTIEALDKIRETMNLLLEYKEIEWQGSLRETYNKYLHPKTLEYDNPEMWKKLGEGEVLDLFQFNTQIGIETAKKVKPSNLLETAVANSLMRLMSDGGSIQPVDQYVMFKADIEKWYQEMSEHGLNKSEMEVLEKYLKSIYGVADTQEVIMQMVMDDKISNFSVEESNKLRKAVAKKKKEALEEVKTLFYNLGRKLGTSEALLDYIWKIQVKRQEGYSFSLLHTLAYSLIALQEMNIYFKYNPLYWNTAVLTVNAASSEDEDEENSGDDKSKSTNYGKVASAIGMMQQYGVKIGLPNLNKAHFGFKPDFELNQIIFGLKGINGIGDEAVQAIIENRPYISFEDFIERKQSLLTNSKVIQLIKAGCFESFEPRRTIMDKFIKLNFTSKDKLTLANLNMLIENNLIPEEYSFYSKLYKFRKYVLKTQYKSDGKDKLYVLDDISANFFYEHFSNDSICDFYQNRPVINDTIFKKEYDKKIDGIREWLSQKSTLESLNQKLLQNEWDASASGNLSKWEMDSLSFYYTEHELSRVDFSKYGIVSFNSLPEQPQVVSTYKYKGIDKPVYKLSLICGTVLDKDKNKHTVTLLTVDGVVTVKYYDGAFAYYNKQISKIKDNGKKEIVESSWFTRGNKLVLCGYRRGSQFKPIRYKNTPTKHTTMLIDEINEDGTIKVTVDRQKV